MRRLLLILLSCLLFASPALSEALPLDGPAPYAASPDGFSEDGWSYEDASIKVEAERIFVYNTNVVVARVTITDPSQLRTATAGKYPSKATLGTDVMAQKNNAVLAFSGDYFSYHHQGIVVRSGKLLRNSPHRYRDTLIIDKQGDFHILHPTTKESFAACEDIVREAFCFGPQLVTDGEVLTTLDEVGISCDVTRKHVRQCIGQTGPLSYLVFASEEAKGKEDPAVGLTILECAQLAADLGCINAYNLDGGSSACIMLGDKKLNQSSSGKIRKVGDIIYFATLVPDGKEVQP